MDELTDRLSGRIQWAAPVNIPNPQQELHQRRMHYLHVESADSATTEYEMNELEEMTDKFHAVQFPVPLRHHHSFSVCNQSQNPAGRRRTHTTEGSVHFSSSLDPPLSNDDEEGEQ